MKNFLKKTILLFALSGIVFLGGGVGVARAAETVPDKNSPAAVKTETVKNGSVAPAASSPDKYNYDNEVTGGATNLAIVACGNWYSAIDPACYAGIITFDLYKIVSGLLILSGYIFDFMLDLSIKKEFITQGFVDILWKVMRDFSNMVFIFALLYAGIRTMLFGDDWKKPVMMVVVIALLINFSLFFTKIVIDAGNVLALGVYSGLGVGEGTSVSAAFANHFAPQKFFTFSANNASIAPIIFAIASVVSGFLAWILFKAAFMFMGRLLAFWFLMIFSPFAFITLAFPMLGEKAKFNFSAWLDMLINQAFVAPVFLFFIYVITKALQSGILDSFNTSSPQSGGFIGLIFTPVIITALIIYALKKALGVAESMSGEFGKIGASVGNKALGIGLGLASGGATMALGGAATKLLGSGAMQRMAAKGGVSGLIGRQGVLLADKARNSTFDARNIKLGGIGKGLGAGTGNKDGFRQKEENWMKEKAKEVKLMEMTDTEKEEIRGKSGKENIERKEAAEKTKEKAEEAVNKSAPVKQMRKEKEETKEREDKAVSMAGDASIKKLEAEKRKEAALNGPQKAKAIEELEEASGAEQKALGELRDARKDAKNARDAYDSNSEVKALEEATKTLNELKRIVAEDTKVIDKKVARENKDRRGVYGKSVTLTHSSGWWNRSKKIDKIREGPSSEEKDEENLMKVFKKMSEKEKKGRGEPATATEKSEKPKEEGSPKTE